MMFCIEFSGDKKELENEETLNIFVFVTIGEIL